MALFTKETGKQPHKRGGTIKVGDRTRAKIHLDLLEIAIGKSRGAIQLDLNRSGMSAGSIEDVWKYISNFLNYKKQNGGTEETIKGNGRGDGIEAGD